MLNINSWFYYTCKISPVALTIFTSGGHEVAVIQPCGKEDIDTPTGSSPAVPCPITTITDYPPSHVQVGGYLQIHWPSTATPSMSTLKINNQNKVLLNWSQEKKNIRNISTLVFYRNSFVKQNKYKNQIHNNKML